MHNELLLPLFATSFARQTCLSLDWVVSSVCRNTRNHVARAGRSALSRAAASSVKPPFQSFRVDPAAMCHVPVRPPLAMGKSYRRVLTVLTCSASQGRPVQSLPGASTWLPGKGEVLKLRGRPEATAPRRCPARGSRHVGC
jgi:hypothetical protein